MTPPKPNTPEWLAWRRLGLGASDVPQILLPKANRPAWMSPWGVWLSKMGEEIPRDDMAKVFEAGHQIEQSIADYVVKQLGGQVFSAPGVCATGDEPWKRATPDFTLRALPSSVRGSMALLECKMSRDTRAWANGPPIHVVLQTHWQAHVTGIKEIYVGAFVGYEYHYWKVDHSPELEATIVERASAWWHRHVVGKEPPPIDTSSDAMGFYSRKPKGEEPLRIDPKTDDLARIVDEYNCAVKGAASWAKEAKTYKAQILEATEGKSGIIVEGLGALWANDIKGRRTLDAKRFEADHPGMLDDYYKTGQPSKRFTWKADTKEEDTP